MAHCNIAAAGLTRPWTVQTRGPEFRPRIRGCRSAGSGPAARRSAPPRAALAVRRLGQVRRADHGVVDHEPGRAPGARAPRPRPAARGVPAATASRIASSVRWISAARGALVRRQVLVARTHRQAVGLAHDVGRRPVRSGTRGRAPCSGSPRAAGSPCAPNTATSGCTWLNRRATTVRDAIEMTRAMRAFEHVGDARHAACARRRSAPYGYIVSTDGIHSSVAAGGLQAGRIGFGRARIAREVLVRPELGRVDEHAGDDAVGVLRAPASPAR